MCTSPFRTKLKCSTKLLRNCMQCSMKIILLYRYSDGCYSIPRREKQRAAMIWVQWVHKLADNNKKSQQVSNSTRTLFYLSFKPLHEIKIAKASGKKKLQKTPLLLVWEGKERWIRDGTKLDHEGPWVFSYTKIGGVLNPSDYVSCLHDVKGWHEIEPVFFKPSGRLTSLFVFTPSVFFPNGQF